jgi:hypothetical protein
VRSRVYGRGKKKSVAAGTCPQRNREVGVVGEEFQDKNSADILIGRVKT